MAIQRYEVTAAQSLIPSADGKYVRLDDVINILRNVQKGVFGSVFGYNQTTVYTLNNAILLIGGEINE